MKGAGLILLILCCHVFANAQKIVAQDLVKFYPMEINRISRDLKGKNFKLIRRSSDNLNDDKSATWFWTFRFNQQTNDAIEWLTVSTYEGEKSRIMYETGLYSNYISFVESLKKAGFLFKENVQHEGQNALSSYYDNGTYTVIIQPRSDRWTIYFRKS